MDFTVELARSFGMSPFFVLQQDKDEVIMLINYFIEKSEYDDVQIDSESQKHIKPKAGKNTRIRVNDKTATGGWF